MNRTPRTVLATILGLLFSVGVGATTPASTSVPERAVDLEEAVDGGGESKALKPERHLFPLGEPTWEPPGKDSPPTWSADGSEILFQRTRHEGLAQVWAIAHAKEAGGDTVLYSERAMATLLATWARRGHKAGDSIG